MDPVDLTNLRDMTDGDRELEKTLFEEFYRSCASCLATLAASTAAASSEQWRTAAHAMKGISYNLGANPLGDLCKQAQDDHTADSSAKQSLLGQIESEYTRVKSFLEAA